MIGIMLGALASTSLTTLTVLTSSHAQAQTKASEKQTRKVPTLRGKVYEQLARAQSFADAGDNEQALSILADIAQKQSSMNSYEVAMLHNFYGFIYYNAADNDKALASFKQVVAQPNIPESFEQATLFTIAQLSLMAGYFDDAIQALEQWESLQTGSIPPRNLFIKAQAYYQNKQFTQAKTYITQAVTEQEAQGMLPDEGWLILQRAVHYELKEPQAVKDVLVKLVKLYNQPQYWVQLGAMYGELGLEKEQLATLEAAKQKGYLVNAGDLYNLAQLYFYHQAPIKCAETIESGLAQGVMEENLRHLQFLGQCYQQAKEVHKAIPALLHAATLSDNGELYLQVAQLQLNADDHVNAIKHAQLALEKGTLNNPGLAHLVLGMSLYNQGEYNDALAQFNLAETYKQTQKVAQQWQNYVSGEKANYELLREAVESD
jgi:tetratricopeptide (TPR) repeat protein